MDKQLLKEYSFAIHQIMETAKKGTFLGPFIKECSKILYEFIQCDAIKLKIKDKNKDQLLISLTYKDQYSFESTSPFNVNSTDFYKKKNEIDINELEELIYLISLDKPSCYVAEVTSLLIEGAQLRLQFKKEKLRLTFRSETAYKSYLVLPLFYSKKSLGVVTVSFKGKKPIDENRLFFFQILLQTLGTSMAHRYSEERQRERVKELSCVYKIAKLAGTIDRNIDEILADAVQVIPEGFLFPEIAACKIVFEEKNFISVDYASPLYRLSADILNQKQKCGYVEVIYIKELLPPDDYPFLREEEHLIQAVAGELSSIIERKNLEEDRITLQSQLWHTDRLAKIGQLTAGVAHELNEPLASILGFAQLIAKEDHLPSNVLKDLDKIINASLHAREIVKKLMLFSRQTPPEKKVVNFNEVIKEGLYLLESRLKKSNIAIDYHFAPGLPQIILDPSQFNQILVNLLVNAIQAMPDKGRLTIETKKCEKGVQLIVEDEGIGMSESDKDQAFIPFFTTKDINEGTGLGLSVVHGIVESHLGKIKLQSKKGVGTRFEIFFPSMKH